MGARAKPLSNHHGLQPFGTGARSPRLSDQCGPRFSTTEASTASGWVPLQLLDHRDLRHLVARASYGIGPQGLALLSVGGLRRFRTTRASAALRRRLNCIPTSESVATWGRGGGGGSFACTPPWVYRLGERACATFKPPGPLQLWGGGFCPLSHNRRRHQFGAGASARFQPPGNPLLWAEGLRHFRATRAHLLWCGSQSYLSTNSATGALRWGPSLLANHRRLRHFGSRASTPLTTLWPLPLCGGAFAAFGPPEPTALRRRAFAALRPPVHLLLWCGDLRSVRPPGPPPLWGGGSPPRSQHEELHCLGEGARAAFKIPAPRPICGGGFPNFRTTRDATTLGPGHPPLSNHWGTRC